MANINWMQKRKKFIFKIILNFSKQKLICFTFTVNEILKSISNIFDENFSF